MKKPRFKFTPFQILVHVSAWLPLLWLLWDYYNNNLTVNPIQNIEQRTGKYAIALLALSLACTPANTLFGFRPAITVRRALGVYAFLYAALHFTVFTVLDYGLDWASILQVIAEKPYILAGLAALLILVALAATSFKSSQKRLGKAWKRLHQLVYLAGVLVVIHFALAVKGDLLHLQGAIWQPLFYAVTIGLLLAARIPAVRRAASRLRTRRRPQAAPRPAGVPHRSLEEKRGDL